MYKQYSRTKFSKNVKKQYVVRCLTTFASAFWCHEHPCKANYLANQDKWRGPEMTGI